MIKSILLENFQSHENNKVDFANGVNCIIGKSDSGKTAIMRALRWCAFNKPAGADFIRHGTKKSRVCIEVGNDVIIKTRDKSTSIYMHNGNEYKAFGQNVPEDIQKAFMLDDVNIQSQMDAPFLLSQTPGEIARIFNEVAGIDKIDVALSNITSTSRSLNAKIKGSVEEIKQQKEKIDSFEWLNACVDDIEAAEKIEIKQKENENKIEKISAVVENIKSVEIVNVPDLDIDFNVILNSQNRLSLIESDNSIIKCAILNIESVEIINIPDLDIQFERLEIINADLIKLKSLNENIQNIIDKIIQENEKYIIYKMKADELKKQMPDVCPMCGGVV